MSALNDEQKRKIEESRRKALALRAAKSNKSTPVASSGCYGNQGHTSPLIVKAAPRNFPSLSRSVIGKTVPSKSSVHTWLVNKDTASGSPQSNTGFYGQKTASSGRPASQSTTTTLSTGPHKQSRKSGGARVEGKCVLLSRERFRVDVGYHGGLITLFKNIVSKQYDMATKTWSFELSDYNLLMHQVAEISVTLEPLPRCVLITYQSAIAGRPCPPPVIPHADLSTVDDVLVSKLFPFQRDGVNFAISRGGRILLADDMGLGKTLQALCVAAYYRRDWPLLVVCPSSVRFTWRQQILRWLPSVDPQDINVVVTGKESGVEGKIIVISYDLMVRKHQQLLNKAFGMVIMDESHFLKNQKTSRTQMAIPILKKACRLLLLSGTPALSRPSELFIQLSAIDNKLFPKFHEFGVRYCAGKQMAWGWDYSGSSNLTELQIVLEEQIMIRRLKKHVLRELPSKVRQMIILDPGSIRICKDMKSSHTYVDKARGSARHSALLEYFHESGSAKKTAVKQYVLDQLEGGSKFLVFAHHQEVLNEIEEAVSKKYQYIRIDGRTTAEQRSLYCDRFQSDDGVRLAILSICAANAGINLTAASLVIFAELFWNPGILVQAEDRVHRIGQEDSVNIHYLVAKQTADDYIWPLVQAKLEVLSRAGLSKEDFTEAETHHMKDPKQRDIMSYFQESFFDDDMTFEELQASVLNESGQSDDLQSKPAGSLLQYFKPVPSASTNHSTDTTTNHSDPITTNQEVAPEMKEADWLDDEDFNVALEEDDPDAPWPKRTRLKLT